MRAIFVSAILLAGLAAVKAKPVDLSAPGMLFDSVTADGFVRHFVNLGKLNVAGIDIPIRIDFLSNRKTPSAFGGVGLGCSAMESRAVLVRETMMRIELPCGKRLFMRRSDATPKMFRSVNREWKGYLDGGSFTMWRDDGWKLSYVEGRLAQMTTDSGRTVTWTFSGSTAYQVREDGNILLDVEIEPSTGLVKEIDFGGMHWVFEYAKRPRLVKVAGQNLIESFDPALSVLKCGRRSYGFGFTVNEKVIPRLEVSENGLASRAFSWDPETGYILSDGEWHYEVAKLPSAGPRERPIIRRSESGGRAESYFNDVNLNATIVADADGMITRTFYSGAPGPLNGQTVRVEKVVGGRSLTVKRNSYDEMGRLIRQMDESGRYTVFKYDDKGVRTKAEIEPHRDSEILRVLSEQEQSLQAMITKATSGSQRSKALYDLGAFYLHKSKEPSKVLGIIDLIPGRVWKYQLKSQWVSHSETLSPDQRVVEYYTLIEDFPEYRDKIMTMMEFGKERHGF